MEKQQKLSLYTYGKEPECVYLVKLIQNIEDSKLQKKIQKYVGKTISSSRKVLKNLFQGAVTQVVVSSTDINNEILQVRINQSYQAGMDGYISHRLYQLRTTVGIPPQIIYGLFRALKACKKTYLKLARQAINDLTKITEVTTC